MLTSPNLMLWASLVAVPLATWIVLRRRPGAGRALAIAALAIYASVLIGLAFGGVPLDGELRESLQQQSDPVSFWIPFDATLAVARWNPRLAVFLIGGNLLLMAPLGYLLPHTSDRFQQWKPVVLAASTLSLAIELAQLGISHLLGYDYRVFEIDDVIFNTAGAWLGWGVWKRLHARSTQ